MKRNFIRAENWDFEADRELQRRNRAVERATARETRRRERAEAARWNREIRQEEGRRVRVTAAETKRRERAEFLKWSKEIHAEETRQEFQRWKGKKKFLEVRKRLARVLQHQKNVRPILISNAIRRNTQKWLVKGDGYKDPLVFLKSTAPTVERLIDSVNSAGKKVNVVLICKMMKTDPATGKTTYTAAHFRSKTHTVFDNVRDEYTIICDRVLENFANFQRRGSGWQLHSIEGLETFRTKFDLVQGKSYARFPKCAVKKKAVINM